MALKSVHALAFVGIRRWNKVLGLAQPCSESSVARVRIALEVAHASTHEVLISWILVLEAATDLLGVIPRRCARGNGGCDDASG